MPDEPFRLIEGSPGYGVALIPKIHRITVGYDRGETVHVTAATIEKNLPVHRVTFFNGRAARISVDGGNLIVSHPR